MMLSEGNTPKLVWRYGESL